MANEILTISEITRESMRILENNCVFTKFVNRDYDDSFAKTGAKIGNTLNVRKPARYVGRVGPTLSIENQTETFIPLTLSRQFGVDVQFSSEDLELSMDDFSERVITPQVATVANDVDNQGLLQAFNIYNLVGTPGTANNALTNYLQGSALLKALACPSDNMRSTVLDPFSEASLVGALTTLFNPTEEIAKQYKDGTMGKAIGFKWSSDQNVPSYTVGPQGGTPQFNGSGAHNGTDGLLSSKGWTSAAAIRLNVGDVFTIGSVYSVNPQSRKSTGKLQQFVVTAQFSSDGSGNGDIAISPSIVASGQFQNCDSLPVGNASLTVVGNAVAGTVSPMSLMFHRDAFIMACADLPLPRGVHMAERISSKKVGMSIRMIQAYDVVNDLFPCRLDILYGWATPYAELACRVQS